MFSVRDKLVFITGGTSGIGLATAARLVDSGAKVVITGRREEGESIAARIGALFFRLDVRDESAIADTLERVQRDWGKIDILFNNAGAENTGSTIEEASAEALQQQFDINVKAAYNVLRHSISRLAKGASVINTSSLAGLVSMPGYSQYAASKAALISLTRTAALELAPRGIRVNAICPGSVWSEMLPEEHPEASAARVISPSERVGEPGDVAALVHFLGSDDSSYISGAVIPVDGGVTAGYGYPLLGAVLGSLEE